MFYKKVKKIFNLIFIGFLHTPQNLKGIKNT